MTLLVLVLLLVVAREWALVLGTLGTAHGAIVLRLQFRGQSCCSPAPGCLRGWSDEPELGDGVSTSTTSWAQHDGGVGVLQQADVALAVQDVATA